MHHIVSVSGGVASAIAAELVINRYGRERVTLWFADTLFEDEDVYRFLDDCLQRWGGELLVHTEGRTPLQVFEQEHVIPNNRLAPCTHRLKIKPFTRWLAEQPRPATVHLGIGPDEGHRMAKPTERYQAMSFQVDYPLAWPDAPPKQTYLDVVRGWAISPPRLYAMGFAHNNCGGRCIRGGKGAWLTLLDQFPDRYAQMAVWEREQRALGDNRQYHTILREQRNGVRYHVTLDELAQKPEQLSLFE